MFHSVAGQNDRLCAVLALPKYSGEAKRFGMNMDRRVRIFGFAAVALAGASSAQIASAADLIIPTKAPPPNLITPVAAVNWTGLYVGGAVGGVFDTARFNRPGTGLSDDSIGAIDARPTYSIYGGLNYQVLPWAVIGVEAEHTKLSLATFRELGPAFDFLEEASRIDSVTGRAGFLLWPNTMIYGKAGPAWMKVQGFDGFGTAFQKLLPGIQTGVGIETLVTQNIALRAEASYNYADNLLSLNFGTDLYRPSFLQVQLGLAYKFDVPSGWGNPGVATIQDASSAVAHKSSAMLYKAPPPVAPVANTPNWTGLEAGGFVSANGNMMRYNDSALAESGPYTDFAIGGGWFAGANYQIQQIVIGAEASGNYAATSFNNATGGPPIANFARVDREFAVTGRVGWLAKPETLFYVKGGPAWLRMTPNNIYWTAQNPINTTPVTTMSGYEAGFGVESYLTRYVSVRVEGLYIHTGHEIIFQGVVPNEFTIRPSAASATVGLALHL
jgi:outer membrane immunogenic protein